MFVSRIKKDKPPYPHTIHREPPCSGCVSTHHSRNDSCLLDTCEFSLHFNLAKRTGIRSGGVQHSK